MTDSDQNFILFLDERTKDFVRIARASRGEYSADDVRNEAWLLAFDIGDKRGKPLHPHDPDDCSLLLAHLYNHCVRYGETTVRYATRLDHAAGRGDDNDHHWLLDTLVAEGGEHPLSLLETLESSVPEPHDPDPYSSPAAGWAWLLRHFKQHVADVADFLLISPSWCYACLRKARHLAVTQHPLPHHLKTPDGEAAIQPWRKFKLPQAPSDDPHQLSLDFWARPAQPVSGQLWLL